ncbi:GNAT family N-acetyltransferase [Bacillus norwichensis]|uniref:GNAT family N-acetyltransferase n=1 Tax=Bacillus norwichensis TaxID=2762217 RepID=A0ABR8VP96_9BACI|nr:GNAT family N-acetyltransferase [Bacillus norwichensis]MBD8006604.1 GNAT family N-acetyltransferase [Bacillus norwichensis]
MEIRHIRLEDAEQFSTLIASVDSSNMMLFEPGERKTSKEQEEQNIEKILLQSNSTIIVAEDNDRLIGFVTVLGGESSRSQHAARISVGVTEEFRGKGVATRLLKEAFRWSKEMGLSRLGVTVMKHNERAFSLYLKMGFEVEGEKFQSLMINGKPIDEFYLYKLL